MSVRRINEPVAMPVRADTTAAGVRPRELFNERNRRWLRVEQVLDTWIVDDRWWSSEPVRRHYFICQTSSGQVATIFCDLVDGSWHAHR